MMLFLALAVASDPPPPCLHHLSRDAHRVVTAYDRTHDTNNEGASFSCALGLTASEVRSDLQRINTVAAQPGCSGLRDVLFFPFTIAREQRVATVTDRTVCQYARQIKRSLLASQPLMKNRNLQLGGWRGAFFGDGEIWLNTVKSRSGRPSLRLISLEATERFPAGAVTSPFVPASSAR
jgi:hypothetical protein